MSTESRERTLCLRPVVLHLYISDWSRVVPLPPPYREPSFSSPSSLREECIYTSVIYTSLSTFLSLSFSLSRRLADLPYLSLFILLAENAIRRPNSGPVINVCHVLSSPLLLPAPTAIEQALSQMLKWFPFFLFFFIPLLVLIPSLKYCFLFSLSISCPFILDSIQQGPVSTFNLILAFSILLVSFCTIIE